MEEGVGMRDIKFRAWHKLIKKMINVYVLDQTVYWDNNNIKRIKNTSRGWSDRNTQITFSLDEIHLMQYTGLKDKNGKEIYEGDILATKSLGEPETDEWGVVDFGYTVCEWEALSFMFSKWQPNNEKDSVYNWDYVKVIGNIYKNPELVGEK